MALIIPDQSHPMLEKKWRPSWAVNAVDHLLKIVKEKPMWEVIDFIVEVWKKKDVQVSDYMEERNMLKATRANEFGSDKDHNWRYLAEIPEEVMGIIDMFYLDEIEKMGKKRFWREFAKRYPIFTIAEKI